jgi:CRP/FNR family cyclic AMP-dependent transcriptional regulator
MSTLEATLEAALIGKLAKLGETRRFRKGEVIIREGVVEGHLLVIISGRVQVFSEARDGRTVVIDEHEAGEYVGEMALDGQPRSASISALTDCEVSAVDHAQVLAFLETNPRFARHLIFKLAHRARLATENLKGLALFSVYGRIARLLRALAHPVDGALVVEPAPTQEEFGKRVGASREMVSIILRDLAEGGYIARSGRRLTIVRPLPERW